MGTLRIFISCSEEEGFPRHCGDYLYDLLKNSGYDVFWSGKIYKPGHPPSIFRAEIQKSNIVIAFLHRITKIEGVDEWMPSTYSQQEIAIAFTENKEIIPFIENKVRITGIVPQITQYIPFDRIKGINLKKVLAYIEEKQKAINDEQFRTGLAVIGGITASIIGILVLAYIASQHD